MSMTGQQKHKPGPLKQTNKAHKHGRHRTKGEIDKVTKGKVDVKCISRKKRTLDKHQKRHQAKQIRKHKREDILLEKRKLGKGHAPPHIIAIFPLSQVCNCSEAIQYILDSDDSIASFQQNGITTIISTRHKRRYTILTPNIEDLFSTLDVGKIADSFLFLVPGGSTIDEYHQNLLTTLISQGLPSVVHAVQGLKDIPVKKHAEAKKKIHKQLSKWFPEIKLHNLDNNQDAGVVLRLLANQKQRIISYKKHRSYLLAQNIEFLTDSSEDSKGILKVSGYIRGRPMSVNGLVHLPDLGDFQMTKIEQIKEPFVIRRRTQSKTNGMDEDIEDDMEEDVKEIAVADPLKQVPLVSEAEVDPMEAEQTWPTEDELKAADEAYALFEAEKSQGRKMRRLPKGTSEYQASWIMDENSDDDDDEEGSCDDEDDDGMVEPTEEEDGSEPEQEFDMESVAATTLVNDEQYDEKYFDMDEEQRQLEIYRQERENEMFPDEVDTPMHIPARERFQRYRGLKSFRTSPWDPKENLPTDYARIFQFQNFNHTKKKILKRDDEETDAAQVGLYVTLHIACVPKTYFETWNTDRPMLVFGLLPHEHKMTVMNFVIKRHPSFDDPVKAKDRLVFHVGYRRFIASAIFSQHTTGDKFKAERFLPHSGVTIATVYAPIMFPPAPVLVFTENHQLVATGSCLGSDPNRIVVKKIILSGHPLKINKKSTVVRYMFFNRDDIVWFKPVDLFTKYGRRGHIKEPLGTHGHMKCVFDGPLKAQDTVCMNLYKRLYPKWTYDPCVAAPQPMKLQHTDHVDEVEM